jgi:aldehyde:ferredoxin oxidoreductase
MHGWHGALLHVDLATGEARKESIPADWLISYIGGRGLGVRLLRETYTLDPFHPAMPLIFAVGPLCGTPAPTAARLSVVSRSPLTGTVYDCSVGGRWRLKAAGIDAVRIVGHSPRPVALAVASDGAELLPADGLWGRTVGETVRALEGRGSVAAIGPAGEREVLFASIMMGEGNAAGRGGLGTVMGRKNLKAVVVNGDRATPVADRARFDKARSDVMRLFRASPVIFGELGIDDLRAIVRSNDLCNALGMDTISAAATLSAWGEARGRFPAAEEVEGLLLDIGYRRGEGDLLALGSRRVAEATGRPELSMSVKSLELPAYDPRGAYGMALAYCTSNRGGCHLRAYPISHEILRKPVATDRFSFSGKARIIKIAEDTNAAVDSLVACRFSFFGATIEEYAELLAAATGEAYGPQGLKELGERIYLTERFYNCANGFAAPDDRLPERFFREPGSSGEGIAVHPLDKGRFTEELQKYYRIRGLTPQGTFPDPAFLERLP